MSMSPPVLSLPNPLPVIELSELLAQLRQETLAGKRVWYEGCTLDGRKATAITFSSPLNGEDYANDDDNTGYYLSLNHTRLFFARENSPAGWGISDMETTGVLGDLSDVDKLLEAIWERADKEEARGHGEMVTYDQPVVDVRVKREVVTGVLVRAVERATSDPVYAFVEEIQVFGSYSRGALDCGDLDVIVIVNRHLEEDRESRLERFWAGRQDPTRKAARKLFGNKVRVDLMIAGNRDYVGLPEDFNPVVVWSRKEFPDVRERLSTITENPAEGRFARNHFVSVKRTYGSRDEMEEVMTLVESGKLKLKVVPFPSVVWWSEHDHPPTYDRVGKEALKLIPAGCWWLNQYTGSKDIHYDRLELSVEGIEELIVLMGKVSLYQMQCHLLRHPDGAVCLIPYLERGLRWKCTCFREQRLGKQLTYRLG